MPTEDVQLLNQPLIRDQSVEDIVRQKQYLVSAGDKFEYEEARSPRRWSCRGTILGFLFGFVIPGLGMLTESYYIITTGQIKALWQGAYPECWGGDTAEICPNTDAVYPVGCEQHLKASISYGEFGGIMLGMMLMGFVALSWSIKSSAVMTASCMGVGAILMCVAGLGFDRNDKNYLNILNGVFVTGFTLLGFGVGGEYPVASVNQTERAEDPTFKSQRKKQEPIRGSSVQLMFSMQGWGALFGSVVILILIVLAKETKPQCDVSGYNQAGYNTQTLETLWRVTYALGFPIILFMIVYRIMYMEEPKFRIMHRESSALIIQQTQKIKTRKLIGFYWHRMVGTSLGWLLWDVSFYGNKLFSAPIVNAIYAGKATLLTQNVMLLLITLVSLVGYLVAAWLLDKKWYGRTRMQFYGFLITGLLFLGCGIWFDTLQKDYPQLLMFLYLIINFFGQLGPNATTYILPSELFPTDMRTATHGFSSFSGKVGALLSTILFGYMQSTNLIFLVCAVTGLVGAFLTLLFIPNVSHLELEEADFRWQLILHGNHDRYGGEAVKADNLSLFERVFYGWQKQYGQIFYDSEMK
eukprot:TRINITY_DN6693_c0_g2_i2.p1 TRINITY_DN6693_c0_g2~~TRINITY_DN6693_c0_g2_i2.p1  ORF type:complete len:581 (-),score=53.46 TRINITY_DN6693_c0_g2_i2:3408-5150(-)